MTPESEAATDPPAPYGHGRLRLALGRSGNWVQLAKFATVGASGYVVNLAVFSALVLSDVHYLVAAVCSFLVAVTNNYLWNRLWTFRARAREPRATRAPGSSPSRRSRSSPTSCVCALLVAAGLEEIPAQAIAIVLVTPWNFAANKLWSFRRA